MTLANRWRLHNLRCLVAWSRVNSPYRKTECQARWIGSPMFSLNLFVAIKLWSAMRELCGYSLPNRRSHTGSQFA
jgi:hypothetical protein